jgi:uncharacterized membrane protein
MGRERWSGNWTLWSLLALTCFAVNNFLLSVVGEQATDKGHANISACFVVWAVGGVCGLVAMVVIGPSRVVEGANGVKNSLTVFLVGAINVMATLWLACALAADPSSAGPIIAMLPLSGLIVSALAWVILEEKLRARDCVGMAIAATGPLFMALADESGSALQGLLFGGLCAACLGNSNFMQKLVMRRGASNLSVVIVLFLTVGVAAMVSIGLCCLSGRGLKGIDHDGRLMMYAVASGAFWVLGIIFFQLALMGKAGPAVAISQANSVGVLALQMIFCQPDLQPLKLLGMGLCILGVTILALKEEPSVCASAEAVEDSQSPMSKKLLQGYEAPTSPMSNQSTEDYGETSPSSNRNSDRSRHDSGDACNDLESPLLQAYEPGSPLMGAQEKDVGKEDSMGA